MGDIRFRTFGLNWPGGVERFLPRASECYTGEAERVPSTSTDRPWMYFYDRPTAPYTTPASDEDSKYLCTDLPDVDRIAGMRQTLDCILFQLTPVSGPLQISEKDFAQNLVGMLIDQGPATVAMA